jgi:hypothetical protein
MVEKWTLWNRRSEISTYSVIDKTKKYRVVLVKSGKIHTTERELFLSNLKEARDVARKWVRG